MKLVFGTQYWVACHSVEVWWGTSRLRRAALKKANLILPVSRYTADTIEKMDGIQPSRVKVVYNAIPNSFARLLASDSPPVTIAAPEQKRPLLLSVCTFAKGNEFKGVDTVLQALPKILKTLPSLQYVIVGEGEIRAKLEKIAAQLGVAENVSFVGEVTDAELADFYRRCDAFVLPSRGQELRGEIGGEGFGRVYVEAALAGKPVIGSRCGGASEAVLDGKTGLLVNPASTDEVAEAVLAILGNPRLAAEMGAAGRKWSLDTFSEQALSRSLKELLRPYGVETESLPKLVHAGEQS
jgi:glycosyltransferase involved in cell wall biosynthesis